jgi:hypothetical protein
MEFFQSAVYGNSDNGLNHYYQIRLPGRRDGMEIILVLHLGWACKWTAIISGVAFFKFELGFQLTMFSCSCSLVSVFISIISSSSLISCKVLEIYFTEYLLRRETPKCKFPDFHGVSLNCGLLTLNTSFQTFMVLGGNVVFWVLTFFIDNLAMLSILLLCWMVGWWLCDELGGRTDCNPIEVPSCQLPWGTDGNHWILPSTSIECYF